MDWSARLSSALICLHNQMKRPMAALLVASILATAILGMSSTAAAGDTAVGEFRVSNYAGNFENNNWLWRGYAFSVARETDVTHLWGGAGSNCPQFFGAIFDLTWDNDTPGDGNFTIGDVLTEVEWDTNRDPGNPPQEEQVELDETLTLQPDQYYFIGQGRGIDFGSGCHNATQSIDVENLQIGSPILEEWYPNEDAAYQPSGTGEPSTVVGTTTSSTTPIRVLMGFSYETDVTAAEVVTGGALSTDPDEAIVEGDLIESGAFEDSDETTLYFEISEDFNFDGGTTELVPANPFTVEGPSQDIPFSTTLDGLVDGTTYYYRAVAINEAARSTGETESFVHDGINFASTVSASVEPVGSVTPNDVPVDDGETATFAVSAPSDHVIAYDNIGGDCPTDGGSWDGDTYTTPAISDDCSVQFNTLPIAGLGLTAEISDHDDQDGTGSITRDDTITFQATVEYTGGANIDDLEVTSSPTLNVVSDDCSSTTLSTGDTCQVTYDYEVTYADGQFGMYLAEFQASSDFAEDMATDDKLVVIATDLSISAPALSNDATPTLTGTASTEEGAEVYVTVMDSESQIQTSTATVDENEEFETTVTDDLAEGTYSAEVSFENDIGHVYTAFDFGIIDQTPPPLAVESPQGYINDPLPLVYGFTEPNVDMAIETDNQTITFTADSAGYWQWQPSDELDDGTYSWDVFATDTAGNTSTASADFTVITEDPNAEIDVPVEGYVTNNAQLEFTGTADADTTAVLHIDGEDVSTMSIDSSESWSYTPSEDLDDGPHQAFMVVTDLAGNSYQTPTRNFEIDTQAPAGTIESPADGLVTNDPQPDIYGTAEAGSTVEVFLDGDSLDVVTTDSSGSWSAQFGDDLDEGVYELDATVEDEAGNQSVIDAVEFEIDITAPFIAITTPEDGAVMNSTPPQFDGQSEEDAHIELRINGASIDTVTADSDDLWSYDLEGEMPLGDYELRATATDEAGNSAEATHEFTIVDSVLITSPADQDIVRTSTPTLTGTGEPGDTIDIEVDGQVVGTAEVDDDGFWSWTADDDLDDGDYVFTARGAGDSSDSIDLGIDTVTTDLMITAPDDGALLATPTPTLEGTAPAGADVTIEVDGEAWQTVSADANGQWEWTTDELDDGNRVLRAETFNEAGDLDRDTITVTIDTKPPHLSIFTPDDGEEVDLGWQVIGSSEPGADIMVYIDDQELGSMTVEANGSWSIPGDDDLEPGTYDLRTTSTDEAGNTSVDERTFVVDATMDRLESSVAGGPSCSTGGAGGGTLVLVLMALLLLGLRRRTPNSRRVLQGLGVVSLAALTALAVAIATPNVAHADDAEGFNSHQFHPMPNLGNNLFSTSSATVAPHMDFTAAAAFNFARNPLTLRDADGENIDTIVSSQAISHLMFTMGFFNHFELGVDVPVIVRQTGSALPGTGFGSEQQSFAVGDIRLVPKATLFNTRHGAADNGVALALLVDTHLPTGNSAQFQGGNFRIGPRLAFDAVVAEDFLFAANVGYRYQESQTFENVEIDDLLGWNAGLEYSLNNEIRLTGELFGNFTPAADDFIGDESHMEFMAGAKYHLNNFFVSAGAGAGLLEGYGTPTWRTLLAIGQTSGTRVDDDLYASVAPDADSCADFCPEPEPDCVDDADCTSVPETQCQDRILTQYAGQCRDGSCHYDVTASRCGENEVCGIDDDGDAACVFQAQCDVDDDCTDAPSPTCEADVLTEYHGQCTDDLCSYDATETACSDDEMCGIEDGEPACVHSGATLDEEESQIELSESVHFESESATIDPDSFALLDQVVQILEDNPQILAIEISGHTDSWGDRDFNINLSQQRAESVIQYLQEAGIDPGRLSAVGLGPDEPIADNDTEEGRSQNRRVEIEITDLDQ